MDGKKWIGTSEPRNDELKKNFGALTALKKWRFASSGRQKMDRDERTKKRRVKKNFGALKNGGLPQVDGNHAIGDIPREPDSDSFHWFLC